MHSPCTARPRLLPALLLLVIGAFLCSTTTGAETGGANAFNLFAKENLIAWCVVPFDNRQRTPAERTRMLKGLGLRSLAWDWRQEHLGSLETEIALLREARLELHAVWCWIDGASQGELGASNDRLLATLERTETKVDIWVSFAARFFDGLTEQEKIAKGAGMVATLQKRARAIGCGVSLYNHGDWFGEPRNMIKIIEHLKTEDLGLVYNFHHAHTQLDEYESNLSLMMPYLNTVNLNGMRAQGQRA